MWYFTWTLGIGFAVLLAILNALWGENEEARQIVPQKDKNAQSDQSAGH
ncbi:hypothetical protein GCM10027046_01560 [Uliginosibacterium flavum]|uniref:Cytochrome bd-I oxidase subunit CydX n=1 Tax=Uliginosibacterium flavum TaxID=1396831 RepID=A0ABV2TJK4_9RHOO